MITTLKSTMINWLKATFHNAIIHPLMIFLPSKTANKFHDWNGKWAFNIK